MKIEIIDISAAKDAYCSITYDGVNQELVKPLYCFALSYVEDVVSRLKKDNYYQLPNADMQECLLVNKVVGITMSYPTYVVVCKGSSFKDFTEKLEAAKKAAAR